MPAERDVCPLKIYVRSPCPSELIGQIYDLPESLRLPEAKVGFFLHVAFPSSEVFRCLAVRRQLLEGMLGANLVGFQIHEYTRHFMQTCSRLLNVEATPQGIQLEDRFVDVIHLAIGIDPISLNKHTKMWFNDPSLYIHVVFALARYFLRPTAAYSD